jgi:hypothetical protein
VGESSTSVPTLDLIGKRALLKVGGRHFDSTVREFRVLEASPSGNWVLLMAADIGQRCWKPIADVALVEVLRDLRAEGKAQQAARVDASDGHDLVDVIPPR